jgi:hypothetical protein
MLRLSLPALASHVAAGMLGPPEGSPEPSLNPSIRMGPALWRSRSDRRSQAPAARETVIRFASWGLGGPEDAGQACQ